MNLNSFFLFVKAEYELDLDFLSGCSEVKKLIQNNLENETTSEVF